MCFFAKIPCCYRRIYIKQFISLLDWCQNIRYSGCLKVDRPIQIYNTFSLKLRPRMLCHGFCEDHASTQILFGSTTIPSAVCLAIPRCVLLLHCSPPIATHLYHAHLRPLYINARQYQPCPLMQQLTPSSKFSTPTDPRQRTCPPCPSLSSIFTSLPCSSCNLRFIHKP